MKDKMPGMVSWHKPGVKVVCICANWDPSAIALGFLVPELNKIYTIREVVMGTGRDHTGQFIHDVGFRFEELRNPKLFDIVEGMSEMAFVHHAFRPLEEVEEKKEKKTSIEQFHEIRREVERRDPSPVKKKEVERV